jgi:hypothetical protein
MMSAVPAPPGRNLNTWVIQIVPGNAPVEDSAVFKVLHPGLTATAGVRPGRWRWGVSRWTPLRRRHAAHASATIRVRDICTCTMSSHGNRIVEACAAI